MSCSTNTATQWKPQQIHCHVKIACCLVDIVLMRVSAPACQGCRAESLGVVAKSTPPSCSRPAWSLAAQGMHFCSVQFQATLLPGLRLRLARRPARQELGPPLAPGHQLMA